MFLRRRVCCFCPRIRVKILCLPLTLLAAVGRCALVASGRAGLAAELVGVKVVAILAFSAVLFRASIANCAETLLVVRSALLASSSLGVEVLSNTASLQIGVLLDRQA